MERRPRIDRSIKFDRFSAIDDHFYSDVISKRPLTGEKARAEISAFAAFASLLLGPITFLIIINSKMEEDDVFDHEKRTEMRAFLQILEDTKSVPHSANKQRDDSDDMEIEHTSTSGAKDKSKDKSKTKESTPKKSTSSSSSTTPKKSTTTTPSSEKKKHKSKE